LLGPRRYDALHPDRGRGARPSHASLTQSSGLADELAQGPVAGQQLVGHEARQASPFGQQQFICGPDPPHMLPAAPPSVHAHTLVPLS